MMTSDNPFAVLSNSIFRTFWIAFVFANIGGQIQAVSAAWVMTSLTGSQAMVSLVQTATTLPIMLGAVFAGVLADSFDRRSILLVAQGFMLVMSCLLVGFAFAGLLTPWLLLSFTFLIGAGTALHQPSWHSSIGEWVPRKDLAAAVALNAMGLNATRAIGPATGGLIVAVAGAATAFAINAVSYLALIYALLRWRPTRVPAKLPREPFGRGLRTGLRYFAMSPKLQNPTLRASLFGFGAIAMQSLLPLVARDLLGGSALVFGALLGCFGLGAVIAALLTSHFRRLLRNETLVRLGFILVGLAMLLMAFSSSLVLTGLATFIGGVFWLAIFSLANVVIQMSTPRWVTGRVLSLYMSGIFGGMALGAWVWGQIAETISLPFALSSAGITLFIGAAWGLIMPMDQIQNGDLEPVNSFVEPQLRLDIVPNSGPIQIMVDYRIADQDLPKFAELMQQRRVIRLQAGARQWQLLRDLEDPDIWIESYHFPTWVEYMRYHERRNQVEIDLADAINLIHRGPDKPHVHRMIERETISPRDSHPRRREPPADPGQSPLP